MGFFSSRRTARTCMLVVVRATDICVSVVHAGAVRPRVVYTHRIPFPPKNISALLIERACARAVCTALERGIPALCAATGAGNIDQVLVSYGSAWSEVTTRTIHLERSTPFRASVTLIARLVADAVGPLHTEHGLRTIERSVTDVALDGKSVAAPYDLRARRVEISHLEGFVAAPMAAVDGTIEHCLHGAVPVHTHTTTFISYCTLRALYSHIPHALMIDVDSSATRLSVIRNGVFYESRTISYGSRALAAECAAMSRNVSQEEAGRCLWDTHRGRIGSVPLPMNTSFTGALGTACTELSETYTLPEAIFLILEEPMQQFFTDVCTAVYEESGAGEPRIVALTPHTGGSYVDNTSGRTIDPHTALAACFFHTQYTSGEIEHLGE